MVVVGSFVAFLDEDYNGLVMGAAAAVGCSGGVMNRLGRSMAC